MKIVTIPEELSNEIQRQFLEYNGVLNIINYLSRNNDINFDVLDRYQQEAINRFTILEKLKTEITKQYTPFEFYDYEFNFTNHSIIFEEKK